MKKLFSLFILSIFTLGNTSAQIFTDIPENSQYYNAAEYLSEKGVLNGYSDGSFRPENTINRAEFTKIILGSKYSSSEILRDVPIFNGSVTKNPFYDVDRFQWYAHLIWSAKNKGIINGYNDGTFKPNKQITKGEASKVIANTLLDSYGTLGWFEDGEHWWKAYTDLLKKFAYDKNNYQLEAISTYLYEDGENNITRGEMIEVIYEIEKSKNPEISSGEVSRGEPEYISQKEEVSFDWGYIVIFLDKNSYSDISYGSIIERTYRKQILVPFYNISSHDKFKTSEQGVTFKMRKVAEEKVNDKCLFAGGPTSDVSMLQNNLCKQFFVSGAAGSSYSEITYYLEKNGYYFEIEATFRNPVISQATDSWTQEKENSDRQDLRFFYAELDNFILDILEDVKLITYY